MTQVIVRRAGAEDLEEASALFDAYRQFYGAASDLPASREFLAARLERDESVVLIAYPEPSASVRCAGAVGFAQLYPSFSSVSLGETVILNDLFVAPGWRRAGVARRLVHRAAAYAAGIGAIRLELATQHTNHAALRLYGLLGFIPDSEFIHLTLRLHQLPARNQPSPR
jgi:GNAT superfamily N-acetyltransferase